MPGSALSVRSYPSDAVKMLISAACVALLAAASCTAPSPAHTPSPQAPANEPSAAAAPPLKRRSVKPTISADGRYVVFQSSARAIVPDDTNDAEDIFLSDTETVEMARVSVDSHGRQADGDSYDAVISANGRFVAFVSDAANLVPGDTNGHEDVFVRDLRDAATIRVSIGAGGREGDGSSRSPAIAADGGVIAFASVAGNLVADDTNNSGDVFVHDRKSGLTTRVSVALDGSEAAAGSGEPAISDDGRYVAFYSHAANLVPDDTNKRADVFLFDRTDNSIQRVSVSSEGKESDHDSRRPSISADGRFVAFESWASNLVPGDTNASADIFVRDVRNASTVRASVSSALAEGNAESRAPDISADGRHVVFTSYADNLTEGDTNRHADVFIHDLRSGSTTRVSVDSHGGAGNNHSAEARVNADGGFVVFASKAGNLVPDDTNKSVDVLLRDLRRLKTADVTGALTRHR